jgi:hypothetical protein
VALTDADRRNVERVGGWSLTLGAGWRSVSGKPIFGIEPVGNPLWKVASRVTRGRPSSTGIPHAALRSARNASVGISRRPATMIDRNFPALINLLMVDRDKPDTRAASLTR